MCLITESPYSYSPDELLCLANTRFRSEFRYLQVAHQVFIFMERITQEPTSSTRSKQFWNLLVSLAFTQWALNKDSSSDNHLLLNFKTELVLNNLRLIHVVAVAQKEEPNSQPNLKSRFTQLQIFAKLCANSTIQIVKLLAKTWSLNLFDMWL